MFDKILIANRGEIAIRIIRTCKRLGIKTVAVYSDIDSRSLHIREADEAVFLGPSASSSSYLVKSKLIAAALEHKCQAVHPGYGFLSESSSFVAEVIAAGLVFIGPSAEVVATMGDKIAAKNMAIKAGVPVVPGYNQALADMQTIKEKAAEIGYPVLFKPAAGGGGRGMRIVHSQDQLEAALQSAQDETRKAFGDDRMFLERFIGNPRHIEVQIMADQHGRVVSLGERECSIQRRYQKVIEESPSPVVDQTLRQQLGDRACALAREAGYSNAGTVEFILDQNGDFFFMEMNTRLQVEHPVTEMVTGLDLVELQLRVAAGEPLPITQEEVKLNGWSFEARICAEDPARSFLPSTGLVTRYARLRGENIRLDSGIEAGSCVSVFYDSLLAKVISWGQTREEARCSLVQALNRYHVEGVITNVDFANAILNHPAFIAAEMTTGFIEQHFDEGIAKIAPPKERIEAMVIAATMVYHNRENLMRKSLKPLTTKVGSSAKPKESYSYVVKGDEDIFTVEFQGDPTARLWTFRVNETEYRVISPEFEFFRRRLRLEIDNQSQYFRLQYRHNFIWAAFCGSSRIFEIYTPREWELAHHMPKETSMVRQNELTSPLPGMVVSVLAKSGDRVYRGQDLVVIESMKMESGVSSPCDGTIEEIRTKPGVAVETGDILITFTS
ncbi:MAG: acetyl-CoA carboxylase biotin carboxylase subunit [Desulfobulbaceae bacterium]|nr:acetyl-CoA carboxylase biotin carboxylase subunit [Desulfobulbaceae bacterium]